jgi:hypothetical protein
MKNPPTVVGGILLLTLFRRIREISVNRFLQSGMFQTRDTVDGRDKLAPAAAFRVVRVISWIRLDPQILSILQGKTIHESTRNNTKNYAPAERAASSAA